MPVEVTPQTKNGIASSQKSRTRITARTGTGALRAACGSASMRRNSSTPISATPTAAARKISAASSEMSRKAREIGSITTEPAAVAAPTRPNSAPCRSRNSCVTSTDSVELAASPPPKPAMTPMPRMAIGSDGASAPSR